MLIKGYNLIPEKEGTYDNLWILDNGIKMLVNLEIIFSISLKSQLMMCLSRWNYQNPPKIFTREWCNELFLFAIKKRMMGIQRRNSKNIITDHFLFCNLEGAPFPLWCRKQSPYFSRVDFQRHLLPKCGSPSSEIPSNKTSQTTLMYLKELLQAINFFFYILKETQRDLN